MKIVEVRTDDGRSIARVKMAWSFKARCVGLIRRRALDTDEGLMLMPGGSVHTLGMRFPIDVVFLDRQLRVLGLLNHMAPWRFAFAPAGTRFVLELRAGRIAQVELALNTSVYVCFDDETEEGVIPGIPPGTRGRPLAKPQDSVGRPRPSLSCFAFSLRLPLRGSVRSGHPDRRHHISRPAPIPASKSSSKHSA
jgi:uncharacterized membrane protein (UPF0127 family)